MKDFRTVTLADQVFERLESDIIQGVYPRGEVLTELRLVEQLKRTLNVAQHRLIIQPVVVIIIVELGLSQQRQLFVGR